MSATTSNVKATVAILGGKGTIRYYISKIFLTDTVAEIYPFGDPLDTFLAGSATPQFQTGLLHALVRNAVEVYFQSEFGGYGITQNLFPGYEHPEWIKKGDLELETHAILDGKVKVALLDTGGFLTWLVGPGRVFNWDAEKNVYTIVGPSTAKNTLTHQADVGPSVAQISVLALDPATGVTVPSQLRVAGNIVDYEEHREAVSRVKGIPKGEIVCEDIVAAKEALRKNPSANVTDYVKISGGEGATGITKKNNEFVNPRKGLWKWRTVEEEFRGL